jgi:hypothetical protein
MLVHPPRNLETSPPSPVVLPLGLDAIAGAAVPPSPASATLPRAPPALTHRHSHSVSHHQGVPRGWASMFGSTEGATGSNERGQGQLRVSEDTNVNGHERPQTAASAPIPLAVDVLKRRGRGWIHTVSPE